VLRLASFATAAVLMAASCSTSASPSSVPTGSAPPSVSAASGPSASNSPPIRAASASASPVSSGPKAWSLVVVGDSIPFNSPDDCPGCTGFVARYAQRIQQDTGHAVEVTNLSQHNGLQIDGLLDEMRGDQTRRDALAGADIIVVGIAHNDAPWGSDTDLCDGASTQLDWSKFTPKCLAASTEALRPKLDTILATIVDLRAGKPTVLRTLNRYNDWIGDPSITPAAGKTSRDVIRVYNAMQCKAAVAHGFTCADLSLAFNGKDGLKPSGDLLASDFTHPSDKGNEVIAGVLADLGYAPLAP
jgi:hypothetical protein